MEVDLTFVWVESDASLTVLLGLADFEVSEFLLAIDFSVEGFTPV